MENLHCGRMGLAMVTPKAQPVAWEEVLGGTPYDSFSPLAGVQQQLLAHAKLALPTCAHVADELLKGLDSVCRRSSPPARSGRSGARDHGSPA